jgi:tRNA (mo5U34)-methyltransferase
MSSNYIREKIDKNAQDQRNELSTTGWWHSIDIGGGVITSGVHKLQELRDNYARFNLKDDLRGQRLLDIGCWDGFYSFEAERHGAEVVAVDCWRPENLFFAKKALDSKVEFHELSVYEVTRERLGSFDIVFFLGVLYHLRHPLLALEQVCEVTRDIAVIESHVIDNVFPTDHPVMEFYEFEELGGQYDNWWGPNIDCLTRMARSAGFARIEVLRREPARATIKAFRRWNDKPAAVSSLLRIRGVLNAVTIEDRFPRRGRHAFLMILLEGLPAHARRWETRVEIGGFGIGPIYVGPPGDPQHAGLSQINVPVPAGLEAGKTTVCLWHEGQLSNEYEIELTEGSQW